MSEISKNTNETKFSATTGKKLNIAVLPGDGIGPEIVEQALNVTKAICAKFGHTLTYEYGIVGACAIDSVGEPYPKATHELCMKSDAVLFGAIGDPKYDNNPAAKVRPEQGLLKMRKDLGLYANIRPVSTFPSLIHKSPLRADLVDGADFMCIRELTGGMYFGRPQGRSEDGNTAYDTCVYTREDILTDEASVITGSLGMLPSASVGIHTSVFEPIHGSYPQAAGKNIANPLATILSAALMFEYAFGMVAEGALIREAVAASMSAGIVTEDIADNGTPYKTTEVGEWIVNYISK